MSATIRPSAALRVLAAAAAVEALLLVRLISHPAGGWGECLWATLRTLGLWASGPFIIAALPLAARILRGNNQPLPRETFVALAVIGPVSVTVALLLYGHGMELFLLIGLLAQSVIAARTWFLRAQPDASAASGGL